MEEMNFKKLVTTKEKVYFGIMLVISLLLYLLCIVTIIPIIYILIIALSFYLMQGFTIGMLKHNSVKINEEQFSDIHNKIVEYSQKMNLKKVPDAYVLQSGGLLNAFATRFFFRDFVVIYSDVLEMAYEQGENAVNFIVAHELAHVKRGHLIKKKYILCAEIIPFLGFAYSRACETTCDNFAAALVPENSTEGMLALIAGKKLYKQVNTDALLKSAKEDAGFWTWFYEICSSHPNIVKRINNIRNFQTEK